jgi:hypothetical protein
MSLIAQVKVFVVAPADIPPPTDTVIDTIVTPAGPVNLSPGGSIHLFVDVLTGLGRRAAKSLPVAFVSGLPTGLSVSPWRQQDGHPTLAANEILLELPANLPVNTVFTLNVQGA